MDKIWYGTLDTYHTQELTLASEFGLKILDDQGNGIAIITYPGIMNGNETYYGKVRFPVKISTEPINIDKSKVRIKITGIIDGFFSNNQSFKANGIVDLNEKIMKCSYNCENPFDNGPFELSYRPDKESLFTGDKIERDNSFCIIL